MRKFLLLHFVVIAWYTASAQVSIVEADLPGPGSAYLLGSRTTSLNAISPGGKGSTSWDFSTLVKTETDTAGAWAPSATPYAAQFPSATHAAFNVDTDGETYSYYTTSSSNVEVTGLVFISSGSNPAVPALPAVALKTIQPIDLYTLPLSFGSATKSKGIYRGKEAYDYTPIPGYNVDSVEATLLFEKFDTVDAYGNVETPTLIYDAIRLKTVARRRIYVRGHLKGTATWIDGSTFFSQPAVKETSYSWWAKGVGTEVFKIVYEDSTSATPTKVSWFESDALGVDDLTLSKVSSFIAPNPVQNILGIRSEFLSSYDLSITSMQGKEELSMKSLLGNKYIDVSFMAPGFYIAKLSTKNGEVLKTKFLIQR